MATVSSSHWQRGRKLFLFAIASWCAVLLVGITHNLLTLQKNSSPDLPFGVFTLPGEGLFAQDFSYNILCLRGISGHLVDRPYRMEDQERMLRQTVPSAQFTMGHAYSPVALVLAWPLLHVSGFHAFLIYFIICIAGILLLFYFILLPRTHTPMQFAALAICVFSTGTVSACEVGQTGMLTTVLLGFFWAVLQQRHGSISGGMRLDIPLAVLFWTLCFKPSVAIIPFAFLAGERAWQALTMAVVFLLLTWTLLSSYYGGWLTGLQDYYHLVNHYHEKGFTSFVLAQQTASDKTVIPWLFSIDRAVLLLSSLFLVGLRWTGRITLSELFQLMVWVFLLFSPYLLPSEDWILCLLVVEGFFFKSATLPAMGAKLFLLACIFNLRDNVGLPGIVNFPCKFVLFAWFVMELIQARKRHHRPVLERQLPN